MNLRMKRSTAENLRQRPTGLATTCPRQSTPRSERLSPMREDARASRHYPPEHQILIAGGLMNSLRFSLTDVLGPLVRNQQDQHGQDAAADRQYPPHKPLPPRRHLRR